MMTNLIDEVNSLQVESYLASVVGRHLPLGVLAIIACSMPRTTNRATEAELYRAAAASTTFSPGGIKC